MVQSIDEAITTALSATSNWAGHCLVEVQGWYHIPAAQLTAADAWAAAKLRHPGDTNPPRGAPVFWTGGQHGYGHIALSLGDGMIRSTDAGGTGKPATVALGWVKKKWGLAYAGWTGDLEGVTIPGLPGGHQAGFDVGGWHQGKVVIAKLHYGQTDSDSVRRLQHVLNATSLPPPGDITLAVTGGYNDPTDVVVRVWQKHIGNKPDAAKKSSIGPKQARKLFKTPPYKLT